MADISFGSLQNLSNSIRQAIISERQEDTENERIREAKDFQKSMLLNERKYQAERDTARMDFEKAMYNRRSEDAMELANLPYLKQEEAAASNLEAMLTTVGGPETNLDETLAGPGLTPFAREMIRAGELDIEGGYQPASGLAAIDGIDPQLIELIQRAGSIGGQAGLNAIGIFQPLLDDQLGRALGEQDPNAPLAEAYNEIQYKQGILGGIIAMHQGESPEAIASHANYFGVDVTPENVTAMMASSAGRGTGTGSDSSDIELMDIADEDYYRIASQLGGVYTPPSVDNPDTPWTDESETGSWERPRGLSPTQFNSAILEAYKAESKEAESAPSYFERMVEEYAAWMSGGEEPAWWAELADEERNEINSAATAQ